MSRNITSRNTSKVLEVSMETRGFSLVEMLSVIAVIAILSTFVMLMIPSIKGSRDITKSAYAVAGVLEQARSYALANNTYDWVGFFEEDGSQSSSNPAAGGVGRLVVSLVASQDGTRYSDSTIDGAHPAAFGAGDSSNAVVLTQITPVIKFDNTHMVAVNNGTGTGNNPARPAALTAYQVGDPGLTVINATGLFALHAGSATSNPTTFAYPLKTTGSPAAQYTFSKIIEFNPQGEASKIVENTFSGVGPPSEIEIALQPTHGNVVAPPYSGTTTAAVAIQVEGLSGQVRVYRP